MPSQNARESGLLAQWEVDLWEPGCPGLTANVSRLEDWKHLLNTGE